jgi:hypothetical protein
VRQVVFEFLAHVAPECVVNVGSHVTTIGGADAVFFLGMRFAFIGRGGYGLLECFLGKKN